MRSIVRANRLPKGKLLRVFLERKTGKNRVQQGVICSKALACARGGWLRWMSSAWRGWPPKRSDLRIQGIQDVRLGDEWVKDGGHRSQLPRCRNKRGWKGRIVPPRVASGGRSISLCRSGYVPHTRRFCCNQGRHWCTGSLAHVGRQQHRGHGGSAIGIDGLVYAQRTEIRRSTMS